MGSGSLTIRYWIRLERASGKWDAAVGAAGSASGEAVAECRPSNHHSGNRIDDGQVVEKNTRCGAQATQRERAVEMKKGVRMTQELYDSKMNYARTTRKIELLMASLSTGAQGGYRWGQAP